MPLYEYECGSCGKRFEVIQRFSDEPLSACTACGGPVHRLLSSPAVQFKGTGWYVTDYPRKGQNGEAKDANGAKSTEAKSESKSDSKKSESSSSSSEKTASSPSSSTSA